MEGPIARLQCMSQCARHGRALLRRRVARAGKTWPTSSHDREANLEIHENLVAHEMLAKQLEVAPLMQAYPHRYSVQGTAAAEGTVTIASKGLPSLATMPPPEYGGPGGQWSPETLLVAAAADCFLLMFRAMAAASKLAWEAVDCSAEGVLDRVDGVVRFTELALHARLKLAVGGNVERAQRLLEKAEKACVITNSLALEPKLTTEIVGV